MTTNLAKLYNMIMHGVRILLLVSIVEFILYGSTNYFIKCHSAVSLTLLNPSIVYNDQISEHVANKIAKATKHNVRPMETIDMRFHVKTD
jgi:hypothetical protein